MISQHKFNCCHSICNEFNVNMWWMKTVSLSFTSDQYNFFICHVKMRTKINPTKKFKRTIISCRIDSVIAIQLVSSQVNHDFGLPEKRHSFWYVSFHDVTKTRATQATSSNKFLILSCQLKTELFKTHYQMSLMSPMLLLVSFMLKRAKQIVANLYTYIPVISITKLNFVLYVGLSLPSFLIFILYHFISSNFRCIVAYCQSFQEVDLALSQFPSIRSSCLKKKA
jgi:hypothetical protein